ncbi:hypothetical protein KAJ27_24190 [bacterium]|nr:hypothetical protein [bacterium]
MISQWNVYFLFTNHTTPPKNKFVVIVFTDPKPCGFFINTKIHPFFLNRGLAMPCMAELDHNVEKFLHHKSFVDCTKAYDFEVSGLNKLCGTLSTEAQNQIIEKVSKCPVIEAKHRTKILCEAGIQ